MNLPPYTIRLKYSAGYDPSGDFGYGVTAARVAGEADNVWDVTKADDAEHGKLATDWSWMIGDTESSNEDLLEVLGANTTGVTDMTGLFSYCHSLASVALFDTSSVTGMGNMFDSTGISTIPQFDTSACTYMSYMFNHCENLASVPLLDTSNVTDMSYMFNCDGTSPNQLEDIPLFDTSSCTNMSKMFQYCLNVKSGALALYQQASAQGTVTSHYDTFYGCGENTVSGSAELDQIPGSWGGNA